MATPAEQLGDMPKPTAVDVPLGSEFGMIGVWALWAVFYASAPCGFRGRAGRRTAALLLSSTCVGLAFELAATHVLGILEHNPGYCTLWLTARVPAAVVASWSIGSASRAPPPRARTALHTHPLPPPRGRAPALARRRRARTRSRRRRRRAVTMHMAVSDRTSLPWAAKACLDAATLLGMDIMTEVGGIRNHCWRWPSTALGLGKAEPGLARHIPTAMDTRLWDVPLANYILVIGVVLAHSLLFRFVADSPYCLRRQVEASGAADGPQVVAVRGDVVVGHFMTLENALAVSVGAVGLTWTVIQLLGVGVALVGEWRVATVVVGLPVMVALRSVYLKVASGRRLAVHGTPLLLPMGLTGCFVMNTVRVVTAPSPWTPGMLAVQGVAAALTLALTMWPVARRRGGAGAAPVPPSEGSAGSDGSEGGAAVRESKARNGTGARRRRRRQTES